MAKNRCPFGAPLVYTVELMLNVLAMSHSNNRGDTDGLNNSTIGSLGCFSVLCCTYVRSCATKLLQSRSMLPPMMIKQWKEMSYPCISPDNVNSTLAQPGCTDGPTLIPALNLYLALPEPCCCCRKGLAWLFRLVEKPRTARLRQSVNIVNYTTLPYAGLVSPLLTTDVCR